MTLLAIDPGNDMGVARFEGGMLTHLYLVAAGSHVYAELDYPNWIEKLVIEIPQVYVSSKSRGDPNDLIKVAVQAGEIIGSVRALRVLRVSPREWKGTVPKDVHHARLLSQASVADFAVIEASLAKIPKAKRHNALDAYGLGKWALAQEKTK